MKQISLANHPSIFKWPEINLSPLVVKISPPPIEILCFHTSSFFWQDKRLSGELLIDHRKPLRMSTLKRLAIIDGYFVQIQLQIVEI